jgi:tetratricopeptide (TPR) repeat protein
MTNEQIQSTYEHGLALLEAGAYDQAKLIYQKLLCWIPATSAFYGLMATSNAQLGCHGAAALNFGRAALLDPMTEAVQLNFANSLRAMRDDDSARFFYRRTAILNPSCSDAFFGIGLIACDEGKLERARIHLEVSLAIDPSNLVIRLHASQLLAATGRHLEASVACEEILILAPEIFECYLGKGNALYQLGHSEQAYTTYRRALALAPDNASLRTNAGTVLQRMDQYGEAILQHRKAIVLQPDFAIAHFNLGNAEKSLMQMDHAFISFTRAVTLNPHYTDAEMNRGSILYDLKRYEEALKSYDGCIAHGGYSPSIVTNRGLVLVQLGRYSEAMESHNRALDMDPDHFDALFNRSMLKLLTGDYETGWCDFEARFRLPSLRGTLRKILPDPLPTLSDLEGQRVLVYHEQGLGDVLQFCRYVPLLIDHGAHVTLDVQAGLVELLQTLGDAVCVVSGVDLKHQAFDLVIPIMSLPSLFRTQVETIPKSMPYLRALTDPTQGWRARLASHRKPLIGLVWSGGFRIDHPELWSINERRNIRLEQLERLREVNATFVSLQKGEYGVEQHRRLKDACWSGPELLDFTEELDSFADTAALIENLDLVIAVDTSTAHLAGAMDKELWLLNRFDTCWRWFVERDDSPWYPSARLYRQDASRTWETVIARLVNDLKERFGERPLPER